MPDDLILENSNFQEKSRNWRRSESLKILEYNTKNNNYNNSYIVTAHHEDDQIETLLLKFLRGVHITNFVPVIIYTIYYIPHII